MDMIGIIVSLRCEDILIYCGGVSNTWPDIGGVYFKLSLETVCLYP